MLNVLRWLGGCRRRLDRCGRGRLDDVRNDYRRNRGLCRGCHCRDIPLNADAIFLSIGAAVSGNTRESPLAPIDRQFCSDADGRGDPKASTGARRILNFYRRLARGSTLVFPDHGGHGHDRRPSLRPLYTHSPAPISTTTSAKDRGTPLRKRRQTIKPNPVRESRPARVRIDVSSGGTRTLTSMQSTSLPEPLSRADPREIESNATASIALVRKDAISIDRASRLAQCRRAGWKCARQPALLLYPPLLIARDVSVPFAVRQVKACAVRNRRQRRSFAS